MKTLNKFMKCNWGRLAFAFLVVAAALFVDPSLALAGVLLTSTAQLGNGTTIWISAGSPTGFVPIGNPKNVTFMDGSSSEVDVTNLASTWKEKRLGLPDGGVVAFEVDTDYSDPGQAIALAAKNARTLCDFKVVLPSGITPTATFQGYVRKFNVQTGVDAPVKSSVEFLVTGPVVLS